MSGNGGGVSPGALATGEFKRKLSKREKKELKKQEKINKLKNKENANRGNSGTGDESVAEKLYTGKNTTDLSYIYIRLQSHDMGRGRFGIVL